MVAKRMGVLFRATLSSWFYNTEQKIPRKQRGCLGHTDGGAGFCKEQQHQHRHQLNTILHTYPTKRSRDSSNKQRQHINRKPAPRQRSRSSNTQQHAATPIRSCLNTYLTPQPVLPGALCPAGGVRGLSASVSGPAFRDTFEFSRVDLGRSREAKGNGNGMGERTRMLP